MTRSKTTPRSLSSHQLRSALADVGGPSRADYLLDIVAEAGRTRQRPGWASLEMWAAIAVRPRPEAVPRAAVVFTLLLLLGALLVGTAVYVGSQRMAMDRAPGLPTTSDAWERQLIETPWVTGRVASLAAGPAGLLAVVGGDEPARLVASTDGLSWRVVPRNEHPLLSDDRTFGMPTLLATDEGFLMLQLNEIWASANGDDWRRLAGETTDPDLRLGGPDTAVVGGPGLIAVGDVKAWHSADGSDWTLAFVPPLPDEILAPPDDEVYAAMTGVTAAGNDLVAWGIAEVAVADNPDEHLVMPLLWATHDGRTWRDGADPEMDSVTAVAGGPHGFVAAGRAGDDAAVWLSTDGETWERVGGTAFTSPALRAAAGTSAGYVVVGDDGRCLDTSCADEDMVIWTSADGRSWSRVPSADVFARAKAYGAVAWGARFVVIGAADGTPAIWIGPHQD